MPEPPGREVPPRMEWGLVIGLLLLSAGLRLVGLEVSPPGLFRDEWEKGYTAWELWRTARHGVPGAEGVVVSAPMPLFIETFAGHDRTSAVYQYISAPIVGLMGLTATSTRLAAALAGWLMVLGVWALARRQLGVTAGLIALAVAATHPTGLVFSRWAQQGVVAMAMTVWGLHLLWLWPTAPERHRRAFAVGAAALLGLAAYAYDPVRLVLPLMVVAAFALQWPAVKPELGRSFVWFAVPVVLSFGALAVYTLTSGSSRLSRVGAGDAGVLTLAGNWLRHFTPGFLFVDGDANSRHGLPGNGFLGWGAGILALGGIAGTFLSIQGRESRWRFAAFCWAMVALAPVAAALTNEGVPHALRAGLMVPATALAAATVTLLALPRRGMLAAVATLLAVDLVRSTIGISNQRHDPPGAWEKGVITGLRSALEGQGNVYLSAAVPYANYAALFAEQTDPSAYHEEGIAALRTRIVPPGQMPPMKPGDVHIAPPMPGVPMELHEQAVLLYWVEGGGMRYRRPE